MKQNVIIVFLSLMIGLIQNNYSQTFKGGMLAGMSATQVQGDPCSGYDKPGLFGGFFVNHKLKNKLEFQFELDYIEKGSRMNPREGNGFQSYRLNVNYVEMPLLLKWLYSDKLNFEIGASYGYLVKYHEENNDFSIEENPMKKRDICVVGGVYYNLSEKLKFNFRSSNTFFCFPIRDHLSGARYLWNWGQYNLVLTFALQYQFK